MDFPTMIRIRQHFEDYHLPNISRSIINQFAALDLSKSVNAGATVAVGCSSRGIANYSTIVRATIEALKNAGLKPFIFPAMGSHGAATADGQVNVLENYGISEARMGVAIRSSLDVVKLGETADGVPVYIDKIASQADHIVLINRVKPHTEFEHSIESGLMKMMAIGLGKQKGAAIYHQAIMVRGYPRVILSAARQVLGAANIFCGVAIVENGYGQTAQIAVMRSEDIEETEKKLLAESKRLAARLPFEAADVLIIDEMGKDISGTGFDTKVVGRILMPLVSAEPEKPQIKRIVVCDLTRHTEGNADGVGIADFVTRRLVDKIDMQALKINAITGAEPEHARIPMALDNDRQAIEVAIQSVGMIAPEDLKIIRIKNTMRLAEVDISTAYKSEVLTRDDLEIIRDEHPLAFDPDGNLPPF